jgi:aerobic-type carbon monoxide dehydrogenase small subunit (CoxS/CutS family)
VLDAMQNLRALRCVPGAADSRFGCGLGLCGECTIRVDGRPTRLWCDVN